jgi:hypothetical protein
MEESQKEMGGPGGANKGREARYTSISRSGLWIDWGLWLSRWVLVLLWLYGVEKITLSDLLLDIVCGSVPGTYSIKSELLSLIAINFIGYQYLLVQLHIGQQISRPIPDYYDQSCAHGSEWHQVTLHGHQHLLSHLKGCLLFGDPPAESMKTLVSWFASLSPAQGELCHSGLCGSGLCLSKSSLT